MRGRWRRELSLVLPLCCAVSVAACGPSPKLTDMEHAQHGIVPRENPAFAADLNDCAVPVYARGLVVNGRKVTDRQGATAAYLAWLKQTYTFDAAPEAPLPPKTKQIAARGNPSLVTGSTPSAAQTEPAFVKDYFAYEKATWDCVRSRGWSEIRG